jgi:DNA-binding beta-propeller fold protein YncE
MWTIRRGACGVSIISGVCMGLAVVATGPVEAAEMFQLESATTLPSAGEPRWDYLDFDARANAVFIARRGDGLAVVDVTGRTPIRTLDNSEGANGAIFADEFDRGYVANVDGTVTQFELSTLKVLDRFKIDDGDLNSGFYEPVTKRVFVLTGERPETSTLIALDAKTGRVLGRTDIKSKKLDNPVVDGAGMIYVPDRANSTIIAISAKDMKTVATWTTGECVNPVPLDIDKADRRLFFACRGSKPVIAVMNADTGKIVATLPGARGPDGLVYDPETKLIVTSNGDDGNLLVIRQIAADEYRLIETTSTRAGARTMAYDPKTKKVYVVSAGVSFLSTEPGPKAPTRVFHKDSFTLLTYVRK